MNRLTYTALKMLEYMSGDVKRINHFMKVHGYAALIAEGEGLSGSERELVEAAAYTHDIGIKLSEEKYNSSSGYYQQIEGPAEAERLLKEVGYDDEFINRVKFLISKHHKYDNITGIDYRILVEADFIVNADEDKLGIDAVNKVYKEIFRTETGKRIMRSLYNIGQ